MKQIIDGCCWVSCPKKMDCYRFSLKKRKGQETFSWWDGCKHFWPKNQGPKKQKK